MSSSVHNLLEMLNKEVVWIIWIVLNKIIWLICFEIILRDFCDRKVQPLQRTDDAGLPTANCCLRDVGLGGRWEPNFDAQINHCFTSDKSFKDTVALWILW